MKKILAALAIGIIAIQYLHIYVQDELIKHQRILIDKQKQYIFMLKGEALAQSQKHLELLASLEYISGAEVTMYNAVPEQTDSSPFITASGDVIDPDKASEYRWVAVSRDLHERWGGSLRFGDLIYIQSGSQYDGVYIVKDTMNKRWTKRIDVLRTEGEPHFKLDEAHVFRISKKQRYLFTSLEYTIP